MKLVFFILPILIFIVVVFNRCTNFQTQNVKKASPKESFYDLSARTINGNDISMSDYKNKKILIVNVASQCGYTPQYKDLQNLHANFGDKLHILAFPSNDFLGQEPGSNEQIKNFCEVNFGIKFDMFEKISVKGKKIHPIFKWLSDKNKNVLCFYVALQQRGWTIDFERAIMEDEEEQHMSRWHMKHSRVDNYINTWYLVNKFDEKERNIILDSEFFFNSELMGCFNALTFTRKIDMKNKDLLKYFENYIDYNFAKQYNPSFVYPDVRVYCSTYLYTPESI